MPTRDGNVIDARFGQLVIHLPAIDPITIYSEPNLTAPVSRPGLVRRLISCFSDKFSHMPFIDSVLSMSTNNFEMHASSMYRLKVADARLKMGPTCSIVIL